MWLGVSAIVTVGIGMLLFMPLRLTKNGEKVAADGKYPYIIILGAKVKPGGVPSLSLKSRLDTALAYIRQHPDIRIVVSGGQGPDEEQTEASFMRDYLVANGISAERILLEGQSTSTFENLTYSFALLPKEVTGVTIVSNDFHLQRAMYIASKYGYEVDVVAAPTPASIRFKLNMRERLALLKTYIIGAK